MSSFVTTRLVIAGMTSMHSVHAVYTALTPVEGIVHLQIGLGQAMVQHDGRATCEAIAEAIAVAGYEVTECREERGRLRVL
ncbi:MAG TPA: copper chaperone [Gemmatimonadaceae bacterium]